MVIGSFVGLILLALWIYCLLDVITAEETLVRNLPKVMWLILVIIVPTVGGIAWLAVGRPEGSPLPFSPTRTSQPNQSRGSLPAGPSLGGPEDSEQFMRSLEERRRLEAWERDLRRREQQIRDSDDSGDGGPNPNGG